MTGLTQATFAELEYGAKKKTLWEKEKASNRTKAEHQPPLATFSHRSAPCSDLP